MLKLLKNILRYRFFWLIGAAALLLYYDYKTIASFDPTVFVVSDVKEVRLDFLLLEKSRKGSGCTIPSLSILKYFLL